MATRASKEILEIDEGDLSPLISAIDALRTTEGWINVTPGVPAGVVEEQPRSVVTWLVGAAGPAAPLATWMPSPPGSNKPGRFGILHQRGRLNRQGIAGLASIPPSWKTAGDHARRGLLFDVPATSPDEIAEALTGVVEELATVPTTGRYLAELFRR